MKEEDYTIENLIETFRLHTIEAEIRHKKMCVDYQKEHGKEHPCIKDDFSISKALNVICQEIGTLQKSLDKVWDHIYGVED